MIKMGLALRNALSEREITGKGNGMLCPFCKAKVCHENSYIHTGWHGECKLCGCWFNLI
jgi:hypothetical protein